MRAVSSSALRSAFRFASARSASYPSNFQVVKNTSARTFVHYSKTFHAQQQRSFSTKYLKDPKPVADDDARRKGLCWRAKQRGWLELDWLVGTFAEQHLANLSEPQLDLFEELLEADNPDLYNYLSGQEEAPEKFTKNEVYMMMLEYVNEEHPEMMKEMHDGNQNLPGGNIQGTMSRMRAGDA